MSIITTNYHILLEDIPKEGCDLSFEDVVFLSGDTAAAPMWEEGMWLEGPVKVSLQFTRDVDGIYVTGHLEAVASLECHRCLQRYHQPIISDFVYLLIQPHLPMDNKGVAVDESITLVLEADEVPLGDILYEQILLGIPMRHLCSEDCKGLCPICGEDLNRHSCNCRVEKPILLSGAVFRKLH